jgi:hypothetical protein
MNWLNLLAIGRASMERGNPIRFPHNRMFMGVSWKDVSRTLLRTFGSSGMCGRKP